MEESHSRSSSVVEEEEVFEITDFTTVSDWERFIAQITEAITDWQLTCVETYKPLQKHELTTGKWEQLSREVRFSNAIFILTLYQLKQSNDEDQYFDDSDGSTDDSFHFPACMQDMMSMENDFPPRAHCLVRWYGFRSFVTLSLITTGTSGGAGLISESKCNILLSSACIVLSESGCEVPLFIQVQQNWRKMFAGRCIGNGIQTEFEMVHMKKCPPQYRHISGLLYAFRAKLGHVMTPIVISARFTYILSDWGRRGAWPEEPIDPDVAAQTLDKLQFGCLDDPVSDLQLSAVWSSLSEAVVVETDMRSSFKPLIAPVWNVKVSYTDNPECLLSSYLRDMLKLTTTVETFSNLIKTTLKGNEQDMGQALSRLTESSHKVKQMVPLMPELTKGISRFVATPTSVWASRMNSSLHRTTGPISQTMLELVMNFLFSENKSNLDAEFENKIEEKIDTSNKLEFQLKSAPNDSLTYRLGICLTVMNYCHGGITAIAQVWHEFLQEMRYRFENGIPIIGISSESPDLRCCLLHQKLQMLNCCILHKTARESKAKSTFDADSGEIVDQSVLTEPNPTELDERNIKSTRNESAHKLTEVDRTEPDHCVPEESDLNRQKDMEAVNPGSEYDVSQQNTAVKHDVDMESASSAKPETDKIQISESESSHSTTVLDRKDSTVSQKSNAWQDEVSSIEDEFFDCDEGDIIEEEVPERPIVEKDPSHQDVIGTAEDASTETSDKRAGDPYKNTTNTGTSVPGKSAKDIDNAWLDTSAPTPVSKVDKDAGDNAVTSTSDLDKALHGAVDATVDSSGTTDSDFKSLSPDTSEVALSHADIPSDHTAKPEGRLEPFGTVTLEHFNTPLYIPITQDPAPITEDILEEQTRIFSSLGDSIEGASLRRKMQSASLLSDMESFKAANPGCMLLDFVRWYSPRDYEIVDGKGRLSERMKLPGNLWQTMWDTAKSVPARRQKRLFDDTKEGEKVLHYLASLQPKDLVLHLLPMCFHEAVSILKRESSLDFPSLSRLCDQILLQSCKIFRGNFVENLTKLEDILQKIQFMETLIARVMSLKHKFKNVTEIDNFVRNVIENPEVTLENAASGEVGNVIKQYFLDQAIAKMQESTESETPDDAPSFPKPIGREFILRTTSSNPAFQSRALPHRMYAVIMNGEFRLAGAFSTDTVFF